MLLSPLAQRHGFWLSEIGERVARALATESIHFARLVGVPDALGLPIVE